LPPKRCGSADPRWTSLALSGIGCGRRLSPSKTRKVKGGTLMSDALQAKIDEIVAPSAGNPAPRERGATHRGRCQGPQYRRRRNRCGFDDIPTVTMRQRDLSLDLARVTSRRQRIVFDKPVAEMENRRLTKYRRSENAATSRWSAPTKVPVVNMKRHKIIYDVPEVTMKRKGFSTKVPEFGMKPQRW
jgi:hypothetical protein